MKIAKTMMTVVASGCTIGEIKVRQPSAALGSGHRTCTGTRTTGAVVLDDSFRAAKLGGVAFGLSSS